MHPAASGRMAIFGVPPIMMGVSHIVGSSMQLLLTLIIALVWIGGTVAWVTRMVVGGLIG